MTKSRNHRQYPTSSITRHNPAADEEEDKWVAAEGVFQLRQAKKKAILRVRGGRTEPIDWLAVTLRAININDDNLDENEYEGELEVVDPEGVFEGLNEQELQKLDEDIQLFVDRETEQVNQEYWNTMKIVCKDRLENINGLAATARGISSVASDIDRMFSSKAYQELIALEKQIRDKLESDDEDIDVDYWEPLLKTLLSWKAKAKLRQLSADIVRGRLDQLRKEQIMTAAVVKNDIASTYNLTFAELTPNPSYPDPVPFLKLRVQDKGREKIIDESAYLEKVAQDRKKVIKLGYVPMAKNDKDNFTTDTATATTSSHLNTVVIPTEDGFKASLLYNQEAAKGFDENEQVFASEGKVDIASKAHWEGKHRPRKPKYFNRLQMGYEWNKYNQTHYDHDHPPPKVVQGYKFNVFYPYLIDPTKAPTFKIEREGGRRRGQSYARAGEVDTCLIRFIAGPPYEDIAFRIVDREWDYSAKRERGFKSSFEKGILRLHFQFKKIYYRK